MDMRDEGNDATAGPLRRRNHLVTVQRGSKRGARGNASEERDAHRHERTKTTGRLDRYVGRGGGDRGGRSLGDADTEVRQNP